MKTRRKSLFSVILAGVFASGLAIAATPDVDNVLAGRGWDMGACRVPSGTTSTTGVYFKDGEIINMLLHINNYNDSPDVRDIWINGYPLFLCKVEMGESRYTSGGSDKYADVMSCFLGGIYFDVPDSNINDEAAVQRTIDRYRDSTAAAYKFTPTASTSVTAPRYAAVQLEFYVSGGIGYVKITKNCTVKGIATGSVGPYDYNVVPGYSGTRFQKYSIYAYHFAKNEPNVIARIEEANSIYVTQTIGGYTSEKGGQIFVNGNVVIGSCDYTDMVVKGKITVVATGNIWIADSIKVDDNGGTQRDANGMPKADNPNSNPNVLGLIAQGVVKIVDPGQSPSSSPSPPSGYTFVRVCNGSSPTNNTRYLPDPTVVEAAITVGGGGWGAEYVGGGSSGRKEFSGNSDTLIVRGAISEVVRGVVNLGDPITDGYAKSYHYDSRLLPVYVPPVCSEQIPGDLDGDYKVDFDDVAIMAAHWIEKGYVIIYNYTLNTLPNWAMEGQWMFGQPTGSGGSGNSNPDPTSGYTGSNVYGVNLYGDYTVAVGGPYYLTAGPFNCRQFYNTKLRFARWLNTDEPNYVTCKIEASNDGTNWNTVWENTAAVTDSNWQVVEYDVSETADNQATVYFRWSYQILSDRAYPYSGWNIDDIELLGKFTGHARAGTILDILDMPGASFTCIYDIDGNNLVGSYGDGTYLYGFLYNGSIWTTINYPAVPDTEVYGIDGNNLVGYYTDTSSFHGFLYDGSNWTTLDAPGATNTLASGISGSNIVGYYYDTSSTHGFLYDGSNWTTLDAPGATSTYAYGISGSNIVGSYYDAYGEHGFLYNGSTWTTLDKPGTTHIEIFGIDGNNLVGRYADASIYNHGFLYNGTTWTTIDAPGATNTNTYGISGSNIVGSCYYDTSSYHGFISIPVSLPLVCSEPITGDLNGDCVVDFEDFAIMAAHWLQKSYVIIANFAFDTNPNWTTQGQWQFGTPMGRGGGSHGHPDPIAGYTGQNVYGVNLNGDYTVAVGGPYTLTTGPFDCNSYETVELSFARWLNTDTADFVQCKVEASNDGSTWQTVWLNSTTEPITDNQWQIVDYDISQIAAGHSQVYIRWSYQILDGRAFPYSGWNIDDVELQGFLN